MPEMHPSHDWAYHTGMQGYKCTRCSICTCHEWRISSKRCTFLGEEEDA